MNAVMRRHWLAAVVAVSVTAACSSGGGFNMVSLEEEWALGQQLSRDIAQQMPLSRDARANQIINQMGQSIVAQTEMRQLPWQFHIVESNEINAFNIPGGHVYVTTGLINATDNAAELAGVMAHEIAHGTQRHGTQQLSQAYGLQILAGVVLGQNPATYQQILAQVIGTGALARFGREAERESDALGVRYMYDAGYDPRGMATMFEELLSREQGGGRGAVENFFATHPLTSERLQSVSRDASRLPAKSGLQMNTSAYQELKNRV